MVINYKKKTKTQTFKSLPERVIKPQERRNSELGWIFPHLWVQIFFHHSRPWWLKAPQPAKLEILLSGRSITVQVRGPDLDSRNPHSTARKWQLDCNSSTCKTETGDPWASCLARLAVPASSGFDLVTLPQRMICKSSWGRLLMSASSLHMLMHTCAFIKGA